MNYIMLNGKKIELSEETAQNIVSQLKEPKVIRVPGNIKIEWEFDWKGIQFGGVSCEEGETNKKNNCPNYKRKWYKFWIKQA